MPSLPPVSVIATPDALLKGHTGSVEQVHCCRADANILVSASSDGTARVWDLRVQRAVNCMITDNRSPATSAVSNDGRTVLVVCGSDLQLYDLRAAPIVIREPLALLYHGEDDLNQVCLDSQRNTFIVVDDAGNWTHGTLNGAEEATRTIQKAHDNIVTSVAICAGRKPRCITGGMDGHVKIWKLSGELLGTIDTSQSSESNVMQASMVHSVASSNDGQIFAAGLGCSDITLCSTPTRAMVARLHGHSGIVSCLEFCAFRPQDRIASVSTDSTVVIWSLQSESSSPQLPVQRGLTRPEREIFDHQLMQQRARLAHKPNWVTSATDGRIFIADSSSSISLFHVDRL